MKNTKHKNIFLVLLINLALGFNTADANFFDKVKEAAKKTAEASRVALEKAKEAAEATLEYTKEQIEEIEKERAGKKTSDTTPESKKEKLEEISLEDISKDAEINISSHDDTSTQDHISDEMFPWKQTRDLTASTSNTTNNGIIVIEGNVKNSTRWVMVEVTKGDSRQQILLEPQDGKFKTQDIGLQAGAGEYKVLIAESSSQDRLDQYNVTSQKKIINLDNSDMSFLLPSPEIQSTNEQIVELAKDIAGHARTQREALTLINEWMVENLKYDWEAYRSGSFHNDAHDAVTIMEKRIAVCEGYSRLFAALARAAGIRTKFIHGKGYTGTQWGGHAWNEVFIEGRWLNVDVTWNNPMSPKKYLLIENAEFMKNHKKEKELTY